MPIVSGAEPSTRIMKILRTIVRDRRKKTTERHSGDLILRSYCNSDRAVLAPLVLDLRDSHFTKCIKSVTTMSNTSDMPFVATQIGVSQRMLRTM